jgi:hypothetical protein
MIRLTLPFVLALAACPGGYGSGGPPQGDPRLELDARVLEPGTGEPAATGASGAAGVIRLQGSFDAPDPCQTVTGALDTEGDEVTVRVVVRSTGEPCIQMIATFVYEGTVRDLAPGTYRLRVVHEYPGTGWDAQPVLDTRVTVG